MQVDVAFAQGLQCDHLQIQVVARRLVEQRGKAHGGVLREHQQPGALVGGLGDPARQQGLDLIPGPRLRYGKLCGGEPERTHCFNSRSQ